MSDTTDVIEKEDVKDKAGTLENVKVYFKGSTSDNEVLEWIKSKADVQFDLQDFRPIKEDVVAKLPGSLQRTYYKVLGGYELLNLTPKHEVESGVPFDLSKSIKDLVKDTPGFHHTSVRADEVDLFKERGYLTVGVLREKDGKPALVEMKVNEENYRATLRHLAREPERLLKDTKEGFNDQIVSNKKYVRKYRANDD